MRTAAVAFSDEWFDISGMYHIIVVYATTYSYPQSLIVCTCIHRNRVYSVRSEVTRRDGDAVSTAINTLLEDLQNSPRRRAL